MTVDDHTLYYVKEASTDQWAVEMHFLTSATAQVKQSDWDSMLAAMASKGNGMVCMSLDDWDDINKMTSAFCSSPHINCNYEVAPGISLKSAVNNLFGALAIASGRKFNLVE